MRLCKECFRDQSWIQNAAEDATFGHCDFDHSGHESWPVEAWAESFTQVATLYAVNPGGNPTIDDLPHWLDRDWGVFALSDSSAIDAILAAACPSYLPLRGKAVQLRTSGISPDHISEWTNFTEEIKFHNRYFPQCVPNENALLQALVARTRDIGTDVTLFRGRQAHDPGSVFAPSDMGAPPRTSASPGRANPLGVPYLYLSLEEETCVYEVRPGTLAHVSLGEFHTLRDLKVADLANSNPPSFFDVSDPSNIDIQVQQILSHRYVSTLGHELSRPLSAYDTELEYVPTQYICEFAKAHDLDGILYESSLKAGGCNLVLFDVAAAVCVNVRDVRVSDIYINFE
jgi:RES domain-containing protein